MHIHRVVRDDFQSELLIRQTHIRDERVLHVAKLASPAFVTHPGELAVRPDAETKRVAFGMILFADVRKIDVADSVPLVKRDEQRAITDWNITGHKVSDE